MDLYRYFHPHHNPRLRAVPLRIQELGELEQAATELARALERAALRSGHAPVGGISAEHLEQVLEAARYIVDSLHLLTAAHPGDTVDEMTRLLDERANAPGWETWSRLVRQRLRDELDASLLSASQSIAFTTDRSADWWSESESETGLEEDEQLTLNGSYTVGHLDSSSIAEEGQGPGDLESSVSSAIDSDQ